jgi:hypothetical protein
MSLNCFVMDVLDGFWRDSSSDVEQAVRAVCYCVHSEGRLALSRSSRPPHRPSDESQENERKHQLNEGRPANEMENMNEVGRGRRRKRGLALVV